MDRGLCMKRIAVILFSVLCGGLIGSPVRSSLGARGSNSGDPNLPFLTEVEYIESTGTQYIDTGIHADENTSVQVHVAWMDISGYDKVAFGCDNGSTFNGGFTLQTTANGAVFRFIRGSQYKDVSRPTAEQFYDITVGPDGIEIDGALTPMSATSSFVTVGTLPLFAWRRVQNVTCGTVRIGSARIYDGSTIVRDFIAVRFINEEFQDEGALYDKVSGEFFRNQGTGYFLIGPDK